MVNGLRPIRKLRIVVRIIYDSLIADEVLNSNYESCLSSS
jgi:hypothetical protein